MPTQAQAAAVTEELRARSKLPPHIYKVLQALPENTHPMTQFVSLISALQVGSSIQGCCLLMLLWHLLHVRSCAQAARQVLGHMQRSSDVISRCSRRRAFKGPPPPSPVLQQTI